MTKYTTMPHWLTAFIDAILPPREDVVTARKITKRDIALLFHPRLTKEPWLVALFPYRSPQVRALIRSVKFYGEKAPLADMAEVAGGFIAEMISDRKQMAGWDTPLLIPMASSEKRLRKRGYNQVERFAEAISHNLGESVTYTPNVLSREDRKSQVRVPNEEREHNIYGAFYVTDEEAVRGKQIVLLDDVVESGATMKDARRALLAAGASDVLGIAIAH